MGVFKFKNFSICDDRASMKVGTDGVLLGAWADVKGAKTILDIGTGSGVIALMMAQRSDADAKIEGIELLTEDTQQASENFLRSPWPHKLSVINTDILRFNPGITYDRIVCNPPYFSKSLLPETESRIKTRHTVALTSDGLLDAVLRLLSATGKVCVILPAMEAGDFMLKANSRKLFLHRLTRFFTRAGKQQERSLMKFGFIQSPVQEDSLILYQNGNRWTDEYREITRDFYLD